MRLQAHPRSPARTVGTARTARTVAALAVVAALLLPGSLDLTPETQRTIELSTFDVSPSCRESLFQEWYTELWETYGEGAVVSMKFTPTDDQLARMGLPSHAVLAANDFTTPTIIWEDGRLERVDLPKNLATGHNPNHGGGGGSDSDALMTWAGTGCLGIRPGSFLLTEQGSLCSMAHVYGSPGSYKISTAGHCTEKAGEGMIAVAALAEDEGLTGVVLYEFGRTAQTTGDGGIGNDWALIDIYDHAQDITSPTMCFWGGPRGVYEEEGALVTSELPRNGLVPQPSVDADPAYAQGIVHFGHGLGLGTGGTPRVGVSQFWDERYFAFYGAITPGDSGSGSNTALGEAAGINTHIVLVDPPRIANTMGALMVGTRASHVGTPADGQIVAYPVPVEGLP